MGKLTRFGVAMDDGILQRFDAHIQKHGYVNRSEAFRDLIRKEFIQDEWREEKDIAGAITLIYDHHQRDLLNKITDIQHDFQNIIISTQHIHLDHHNCLEIIAVKGSSRKAHNLADLLKALKGVKHGTLSMSSTGKEL